MLTFLFAALAQLAAVPPASPPPPLVRMASPPEPAAAAAAKVGTDREMIRSYERHGPDAGRGRLIEAVWPQIEALRAHHAKRLAGIYFDEDGALVLRLLGRTPVANTQLETAAGALPVRFRTGWLLTDREVMQRMAAKLPELRRLLPDMTGAAVDERSGRLFITYPGADARITAREGEISRLIGAPVWIGVPGA